MTQIYSFQLTVQCRNYMAGMSMSFPQCCLAMKSECKRRQRRPACTCRMYSVLWQQCWEGTAPSFIQLAHLCHNQSSSSDCHIAVLPRWSTSFLKPIRKATPPRCLCLSALMRRGRLKTKRKRSMRQASASTHTQGHVAEVFGPVGDGYVHNAWQRADPPDAMGDKYGAAYFVHTQPEQLC